MKILFVINPLHFNLLINKKNIRFNLEEIEFMEIKNKINYFSLISCLLSLTLFSLLCILFFKITYFSIVINLILFLIHTEFVYKKLYQVNLKIRQQLYSIIINDDDIFEFNFLYETYNKQID